METKSVKVMIMVWCKTEQLQNKKIKWKGEWLTQMTHISLRLQLLLNEHFCFSCFSFQALLFGDCMSGINFPLPDNFILSADSVW